MATNRNDIIRDLITALGGTPEGKTRNELLSEWLEAIDSAPWTPADIATELWFDGSDASTITESLGSVSQWNDKSGNNRHLVQATASKQPTTNSATVNGLNAIAFDDVDDGMTTGHLINTPSWAMYLVEDTTALSNTRRTITSTIGNRLISGTRANNFNVFNEGLISGTAAPIGANILSLERPTSGNFTYKINNVDETDASLAASDWGNFALGSVGTLLEPAACNVCEIVVVSSILDTETDTLLRNYFINKWGI